MGRDLRSIFQRQAPIPTKHIDAMSLVREGQRRRRVRYVAYGAAAGVAVIVGAATMSVVLPEDRAGQPAAPEPSATTTPTDAPTSSVPTPLFENLTADWTRLADPPEARNEAVAVWTGRTSSGRDLILWGGYSGFGAEAHDDGFSWDPETNAWTPLAPSPVAGRAEAGAVFTGTEVVIWGGYGEGQAPVADGAAYNPETDEWRVLPPAPIPAAVPVATVWTGEEVLIWGSMVRDAGSREGAAYNPATNEWRALPEAPFAINLGTGVWADGDPAQRHEMIVFGGVLDNDNSSKLDHALGMAYDPESDTWRELPEVDLAAQGSTIAWTNEKVVAWDVGLRAAEYDRVTNRWRHLPRVPFKSYECYPAHVTQTVGSYVFARFCDQAAGWDLLDERWEVIDMPTNISGEPVVAGEVMLFAGASHEGQHNSMWVYVPPGGGP